jgi:hypothetical protein
VVVEPSGFVCTDFVVVDDDSTPDAEVDCCCAFEPVTVEPHATQTEVPLTQPKHDVAPEHFAGSPVTAEASGADAPEAGDAATCAAVAFEHAAPMEYAAPSANQVPSGFCDSPAAVYLQPSWQKSIPAPGPMPGQLYLLPSLGEYVPNGAQPSGFEPGTGTHTWSVPSG